MCPFRIFIGVFSTSTFLPETDMLMESQCGGNHNSNGSTTHHHNQQQSIGHYQFRDRKKSCGTPPLAPPSPTPSSASSGRLPAFARFHSHHPGPSSVMSESTTSTSSLCSTPTRSGATTPTQQNYGQMKEMVEQRSQAYAQNFTNRYTQPHSYYRQPHYPHHHNHHHHHHHQHLHNQNSYYADSDEYRKRSNTLLSNRSDKRWPKRDMGPQFELRCCIDPEILRINVDRQYYFEDETVRVNGSVFHKRNDYNNLLSVIPRAKFNGIHIKMEDDCPQGGDDVRLCLLKSLGAHNLRSIPCVQCKDELKVYDKYPLIDGVFYISPVSQFGPKTEIALDGRRFYLQQLCARCLWSDWSCKNCGKDEWFDGRSFVLGTLYYYDIVSAGRCCPTVCQTCKQPLGVRDQLATQLANGNYATINEQLTCQSCGASKFHLVRDIKTCHVARGPSFCE